VFLFLINAGFESVLPESDDKHLSFANTSYQRGVYEDLQLAGKWAMPDTKKYGCYCDVTPV